MLIRPRKSNAKGDITTNSKMIGEAEKAYIHDFYDNVSSHENEWVVYNGNEIVGFYKNFNVMGALIRKREDLAGRTLYAREIKYEIYLGLLSEIGK
ncbi:hypothetical protein HYW74_01325 [Candidatus Pacearchaeota archaeon]|nr:hypothetical protein [Candidatus Pacearchaeota archaeon]